METKDKLIGVVCIITGLILIVVGMMPMLNVRIQNPTVVNPYNEVEVYNEVQNNTQYQEEVEQNPVNVYFEEEVKEEGSNRYIY